MLDTRTIAIAISRLTGPESVVPVGMWLVTNGVLAPIEDRIVLLITTGIFFVFFPIITFAVFYFLGKLSDIDVTDRRERPMVLLIKQLWWTVGLVFLGTASPVGTMFLVYAWWYIIGLTALVISLYWKISLHSLGITTLGILMLYVFPYWYMWLYFLLLIVVVWSRWYLNKHSPAQLIAGALVPSVWWFIGLTIY